MSYKAVLRRGTFTNWMTIREPMPEIAVPIPGEINFVALDQDSPENFKNEVWFFRFNQYLAEDMVEYLFDRVERR